MIKTQIDARGIATVTLNRAEKHNALTSAMMSDLTQAAADLAAKLGVRAVVLTGAGPSFCAGGDLGWMRDQMNADATTRTREARKLALMLQAWDQLPIPVIGRVQGNAFGGGIGLMAVCDVVIADSAAQFALTETRLGLIPATIGPYVIARMGAAMARRVFTSSRRFDAAEGVALGLIARAVATCDLDAAVEAEVVPYLSCAPGAVAEAKALIRALAPKIDEAQLQSSIAALVSRWESDEAAEGIAAFFDRRPPRWAV
jgi:methylglutaconyl-CoA hydratase